MKLKKLFNLTGEEQTITIVIDDCTLPLRLVRWNVA